MQFGNGQRGVRIILNTVCSRSHARENETVHICSVISSIIFFSYNTWHFFMASESEIKKRNWILVSTSLKWKKKHNLFMLNDGHKVLWHFQPQNNFILWTLNLSLKTEKPPVEIEIHALWNCFEGNRLLPSTDDWCINHRGSFTHAHTNYFSSILISTASIVKPLNRKTLQLKNCQLKQLELECN